MDRENVNVAAHGLTDFGLRNTHGQIRGKAALRETTAHRKPLGAVNFQTGVSKSVKDAVKGGKVEQPEPSKPLCNLKMVVVPSNSTASSNKPSMDQENVVQRENDQKFAATAVAAENKVANFETDDIEIMHPFTDDDDCETYLADPPARHLNEFKAWQTSISYRIDEPSSPTVPIFGSSDFDSEDFCLSRHDDPMHDLQELPSIDDQRFLDFLCELP